MPITVRELGGVASSILARPGTSMPTADTVNGTKAMRYFNDFWHSRMLKKSASFVLAEKVSST
jgi:ureidoglycolate hydrolase